MSVNLQVDKQNTMTTMTRVFDAPRELLWKAHTDPTLIPKWWSNTTVEKMDVRIDGEWKYVSREGGREDIFYGVYKELQKPEKLTWTFNYEPMGEGHEITETMMFEEVEGGKTKLTTTSQYLSLSDLEGMVASGMEAGANSTWDRLNELVSSMK